MGRPQRVARALIAIAALGACAWTAPADAETSPIIPFQAELVGSGGNAVADGNYEITFIIYDQATGGADLWTEIHPAVSVVDGRLNVLLGTLTPLNDPDENGSLTDAVEFRDDGVPTSVRYLAIKIENGQEMFPRHQLVPSFHARTTDRAHSVDDGAIDTDALADDAVTAAKIVDLQVVTAAIADDAITAAKLDPNAINPDSISQALRELLVPIGSVMAFAGATPPAGWLLCDGTSVDRVAYPDLFAVIGTNHGAVDGFTFNLPDYRGRFLRGVDDPDGAGGVNPAGRDVGPRSTMNDNGEALGVGSVQDPSDALHTHAPGTLAAAISFAGSAMDVLRTPNPIEPWSTPYALGLSGHTADPTNSHYGVPVLGETDTPVPTGTGESRPHNAAVNYIIKY